MTTITYEPVTPDQVAAMTRYALDLAQAYPSAGAERMADKLLTVWQGSPRGLRHQVAMLAICAAGQIAA